MSGQSLVRASIFHRLRWKAILLGFVVDYGGSVVFGTIFGIVLGALYARNGGDPAETQKYLISSTTYLVPALVVGSLFVVVGGCIAGRLAPQARLLNGAALGLVDILLGLTYSSEVPGWYHTTSLLVTLPCALVGAWLSGLFFPHYEAQPPPLP
jgi:ABC-type dipeptide/oligopeptide/nickel transport system permease component